MLHRPFIVVADSSRSHVPGMPYRDVAPRAAPLPRPTRWETLCLWGLVAFSPWLVLAIVLRDAHAHLRLASLSRPLDAAGRAHLLARLEREAPLRVTRFVTVVHTIASGDEEVWNAVVVRFADGVEHVVTAFVGPPAIDHGARVVATARRHRDVGAVLDEEVSLGLPGLAIVLSLLPTFLWAVVLAIGLSPAASLVVLAPLPVALGLHTIARLGARHVLGAPHAFEAP
jgi:hypothetical protein